MCTIELGAVFIGAEGRYNAIHHFLNRALRMAPEEGDCS